MNNGVVSPRLTFLNQPTAVAAGSKVDVAFFGACFDGLERQPGITLGPRKVRELAGIYANSDGSSQPIETYNPDLGFLLDGVRLVDLGDVECSSDCAVAGPAIEAAAHRALAAADIPLLIGGDHYVSYPVIRALQERVVVVHFDAHSDYLDELDVCPHGSLMRAVAGLPHVERIVHLGLRGNLQTRAGIEESLARGNRLATTLELLARGPTLVRELLGEDVLSGRLATYVSFDVDVLDPSVAPGTGTHEPGGLTYLAARELLLDVCQNTRVIGLDFVEFNPRLDWNDLTGKVVVNLALEAVSRAVLKGKTSHSLRAERRV